MGKRRITVVLAAMFLAAGVSAAGAATATAAPALPAHTAVSQHKPAKIDPFTGKLTTQYLTKRDGAETTTYYLWEYAANTNYCIVAPGQVGGALTLDTCDIQNSNEMWTAVAMPASSAWTTYSEIRSDVEIQNGVGQCADDVGGADNVQVLSENCAVVGGQAWTDDYPAWLNAIAFSKGSPPYQGVTLDYGTTKVGAWIVTNPYSGGTLPTDMKWADF